MSAERPFNPLNLDVAAFAKLGAALAGEWPAETLPRLTEGGAPEVPMARWRPVAWQLSGRTEPVLGGETEVWIDLAVQAQAHLTCQRCLKPVAVSLEVDGPYRFVRDEAQAAALDADSEEDVLVISRKFDVREWVEDELLLALPIVPMHEVCPEALPVPGEDAAVVGQSTKPNPFAVLARLKDKVGGAG